jgi:hypothetical protein
VVEATAGPGKTFHLLVELQATTLLVVEDHLLVRLKGVQQINAGVEKPALTVGIVFH